MVSPMHDNQNCTIVPLHRGIEEECIRRASLGGGFPKVEMEVHKVMRTVSWLYLMLKPRLTSPRVTTLCTLLASSIVTALQSTSQSKVFSFITVASASTLDRSQPLGLSTLCQV